MPLDVFPPVIKNLGIAALVSIGFLAPNSTSASSFVCVTDVSGGLIHKNGEWASTSFSSIGKYLLQEAEGSFTYNAIEGMRISAEISHIWSEIGSEQDRVTPCFVDIGNLILCKDHFYDVVFYPDGNSFQMYYSAGFSAATGATDGTPYVATGKCTGLSHVD